MEIKDLLGGINIQAVILLIPILISIYKGICQVFKLSDNFLARNLVAVALCLYTTINLIVGWNIITTSIDTFLILYFGSSGIIDIARILKEPTSTIIIDNNFEEVSAKEIEHINEKEKDK